MAGFDRFPMHRPEVSAALERGERKIIELMQHSARSMPAGRTIIEADIAHNYVYRMIDGWIYRTHPVDDWSKSVASDFSAGRFFRTQEFARSLPDQWRSDAVPRDRGMC